MSTSRYPNSKTKDTFISEEDINNIKIFRRTLENNTHEVIEDTKIKKVTSWRKSNTKFLQSLILNILTIGIIHIISLFYPNLYIKLYCKRRRPKECDFFLVEDIYGTLTLCKIIYKKDKSQNNCNLNSDNSKETIMSSSLPYYNNQFKKTILKNVTYSFQYRSVIYEYNEQTNEIIPVYMNLSNLTCKDIFNHFSEGLSSDNIVKLFQDRYGKNEYNLNFKKIYLYILNIELPNLIIVIIIGFVELYFNDIISFLSKIIIIIILIGGEFINLKLSIYNTYKKEYTLDGEKKIKVKRIHKLTEKSEIYYNLDNCDLLPGDIIYLNSNDYVPCDCLILEGECTVNSNNLIGNLNTLRKISLENKNIPFNYQLNQDNILYHGMKIIKTHSNIKQRYISALCLNTGPNTYKANLYSNALYIFERKNEYKEPYKFFNSDRKSIIIFIIIDFILPIIIIYFYAFKLLNNSSEMFNFKEKKHLNLFISSIIRILCKSILPMNYLLKSFIILIGSIKLKRENIFIFDKTKLLYSSYIDTLFLGKTGTLCEDKYEIISYHPISVNNHNLKNLTFRAYNKNQSKEINLQLIKYYENYLSHDKENFCAKMDNMEKAKLKCYEYSTLFLESLLSCNDLEKYDMELFGNSIDLEIFQSLKWDIKSYVNLNNNTNEDIYYNFNNTDVNSKNMKYNFFEKSKKDIFPKNYYKITKSMENENMNVPKNVNNDKKLIKMFSKLKIEENKNENINSIINNNIEKDIEENNINSYNLRIYKRFIKNGEISSGSITYNFITKELRYNIKGIPEDILDKCNSNTIPDNFHKIISSIRRKGYIIIICATKKLNIEFYNDYDSEDKYMFNLTFCGFIILKNRLKKEIVNALNDLRLLNCKFIIFTGDGIYNTLSTGFESTILENKDIYLFDKDEIKNRIIIKKIYNPNYDKNEGENDSERYKDNLAQNQTNSILDQKKYSFPKYKSSKVSDYSDPNSSYFIKSSKSINQSLIDRTNSFKIKKNAGESSPKRSKNYKMSKISNVSTKYINNNESQRISIDNNNKNTFKKPHMSKKTLETLDFNIKRISQFNQNNINEFLNNKVLYYYDGIFEDHKELEEDCIYCVGGKVFDFLYKNKNKRQSKMFLEKIHKKCKIFFDATSLIKSEIIEYYREYPENCICTIGECQSDIDAIMSSNIGIKLQKPKNINTLLCDFYSPEDNLLLINRIIKVGLAVKENILLMTLSCFTYTLILNSFILNYFIRHFEFKQAQLNYLEIGFLHLSITAFTSKYENKNNFNNTIQKGKLYYWHYIFQIVGLILIKSITTYFHLFIYLPNDILNTEQKDIIYCSFYFLFCIEQLFSTIIVINFISFFRKTWLFNTHFIGICLLILIYFVINITLTNSNYKVDIFNILEFEFLPNLIDAYDEQNKIFIFLVCIADLIISIIYSRIIFYIFKKLIIKKNVVINKD